MKKLFFLLLLALTAYHCGDDDDGGPSTPDCVSEPFLAAGDTECTNSFDTISLELTLNPADSAAFGFDFDNNGDDDMLLTYAYSTAAATQAGIHITVLNDAYEILQATVDEEIQTVTGTHNSYPDAYYEATGNLFLQMVTDTLSSTTVERMVPKLVLEGAIIDESGGAEYASRLNEPQPLYEETYQETFIPQAGPEVDTIYAEGYLRGQFSALDDFNPTSNALYIGFLRLGTPNKYGYIKLEKTGPFTLFVSEVRLQR